MKDRIKAVRQRSGMTQTEFGSMIGASRSMIASYEGGAVIPADTVVELICMKFHVSRLWLTTGEGPMEDIDPADDTPAKLAQAYADLPQRFQDAVQVLMGMDPEWWKVLDRAFAAWEEEKKNAGE